MFKSSDIVLYDVCSLVRFHVWLWGSISKLFCNYFLGNILPSWNPSSERGILVDSVFKSPLGCGPRLKAHV